MRYMKLKATGLKKGDKTVYNSAHKKLLKDIVSSEIKIEEFLNKVEMYDERKVLFLELLCDIRTYGIEKRETIVLEKLDNIESLINETKYIQIDKDFLNNIQVNEKPIAKIKKRNSSDKKKKIIEVDEAFQENWTEAYDTWIIARKYHYSEQNPGAALVYYDKAFNIVLSLFGIVSPDDVLRLYIEDDTSRIYFDIPDPPQFIDIIFIETPVTQMYLWICEDLCICYYDLNKRDNLIKQDQTNLSLFSLLERNYHFPDWGDELPDWDGFELEYVPGYFTYVGYREKQDYAGGISKLNSIISSNPGNWKKGYWNGYKAFLQLFQGKNVEAVNSVNIALPILQSQPLSDQERYKDEIDIIKECKAAAAKNSGSISFYQLLKTQYPSNKYKKYWDLTEGYCNITIGNYSQAIVLLNQVCGISRTTESETWIKAAHLYLALCYYITDDLRKAEENLNIALGMAENNIIDAVSLYVYGKVFEKQDKLQEAFGKYSLIMHKYGDYTNLDIKQIVATAKAQAESILNLNVVNMVDQLPVQGIVGVNQKLSYETFRYSWNFFMDIFIFKN